LQQERIFNDSIYLNQVKANFRKVIAAKNEEIKLLDSINMNKNHIIQVKEARIRKDRGEKWIYRGSIILLVIIAL